jgi:hypothetical protein
MNLRGQGSAMKVFFLATTILLASHQMARADTAGHAALALGVIVGDDSPLLSWTHKEQLMRLLADHKLAHGSHTPIVVKASSVVCQAGDVDLAAFSCTLTFGKATRTRTGRKANELFATLVEAGVPSDGAAGHVYEAVHVLECTLDPTKLAGKDGSGADCSFQVGPS